MKRYTGNLDRAITYLEFGVSGGAFLLHGGSSATPTPAQGSPGLTPSRGCLRIGEASAKER
ncbi:MAG: hypothetical protein MZV64_71870 [Ignavibacteriales bacterium]|nr:hypothetical protein [Ignavibacteriales bacterium]